MGGGELNCGQETPLASVDQSGSGPAAPAGAGRYSAVLNGIRPGACGGSASGLRCLPGATGTTGPPTESGTPEPGAGLGWGGDRVTPPPRGTLGHLVRFGTRTNMSLGTKNPWGGRAVAAEAAGRWRAAPGTSGRAGHGWISADGQAPGPPRVRAWPARRARRCQTAPSRQTGPTPTRLAFLTMHSESVGISDAIPVGITLIRSRVLSKLRAWHARTPVQANPVVRARSPS